MTIAGAVPRGDYFSNGIGPYTGHFQIDLATEIEVLIKGVTGIRNVDYTVAGLGAANCSVTLAVASVANTPIALLRLQPIGQTSGYVVGEGFPSKRVEGDYDKVAKIAQMFSERFQRVFSFAKKSLKVNVAVDDPTDQKFLFYDLATNTLKWGQPVAAAPLADPITIGHGGTGQVTVAAARQAIFDPIFTTKGDLVAASGAALAARVPVGGNGQLLVADNTQIAGIKWVSPAVGIPTIQQIFHGLYLRTHRDADKAANQIAMLSLRSIIMDDGSGYSDVVVPGTDVPLVADITVNGAGGLDTGARVASTWYEAYLIGKSSTQAKADLRLLLHRAKNYALDKNQQAATGSQGINNLSTDQQVAQTFTPALSGLLEIVDVNVVKVGAPIGQFWVEVQADSAGSPSGVALATSDRFDIARLSTTNMLVRMPFRAPA